MARVIPLACAGASGGLEFKSPPPLSLYVHVPWCVRKCPYCDFNSHELIGELPADDYRAALVADLESALPLVWGRRIETVFIGGGTPSLLAPSSVAALIADLRLRLPFAPDAEISLEANPGTVDSGSFEGFRDAGVTRLSLGIQSFDSAHLTALGRIHDGADARRAAALAARHFANFNLDLMFGLPGQDLAAAVADVDAALAFAPPHLSCYQLTIETNTRFAAEPPALPDSDLVADMHEAIVARLADAGYDNYEVSAYARGERRCRHNLNYWRFGDYLGIGAGAHTKLTLHDRVLRQVRWKNPRQYLAQAPAGVPVQEEHAVASADLTFEFMLNALRLAEGFAIGDFERRSGRPWISVAATVATAIAEGLLEQHGERIAPSARGRRYLNVVLERFLAAA